MGNLTILKSLGKRGIEVTLAESGGLRCKPAELLTDKDKREIQKHKAQIVTTLEAQEVDTAGPILADLGYQVRYIRETEHAVELIESLKNLPEASWIGLDIETTGPTQVSGDVVFKGGLDPHLGTIRSIQMADEHGNAYVLDRRYVDPSFLREFFASSTRFMAHNAGFEYRFLKMAGIHPSVLHCTMLMARVVDGLDDSRSYPSLVNAAEKHLGIPVEKATRNSDWGITGPLSQAQIHYAALDAVLALRLARVMEQRLRDTGQVKAYLLMQRALPAVNDVMLNGIGFDRDRHRVLAEDWSKQAQTAEAQFREEAPQVINLNSSTQLAAWLQSILPLDDLIDWPKTANGALSTSSEALSDWPDCPESLRKYKEYQKLCSTYGEAFAANAHPVTGRIHADFRLAGTMGGRFACSKPNIQNPPRSEVFRELFVPRPGYRFVCADFSQIELRVAAIIAQDETMKRAYREGTDLHRLTAANQAGIPPEEVTKEQRQQAKAINFGLLYGMGAKTLAVYARHSYGVEMSHEEAESARRAFFELYRGLASWHRSVSRIGAFESTVRTRTGLVRDMEKEANGWKFTNACNTPVQGSAAECLLAALAKLRDAILKHKLDAYIIHHVHDEILVECRPENVELMKTVLTDAMTGGFLEIFPEELAMTRELVEAHDGDNWSTAKS